MIWNARSRFPDRPDSRFLQLFHVLLLQSARGRGESHHWASSRRRPTIPLPAGEVVAVGDYNGDGYGDLLVSDAATGDLSIALVRGARVQQTTVVTQTEADQAIIGVR